MFAGHTKAQYLTIVSRI